jgi:O-glycosyl hydrolase
MNILRTLAAILVCLIVSQTSFAQVECNGWGELRGIRVQGELVPFKTSIWAAQPGWKQIASTGHWQTRNEKYTHFGNQISSTGQIGFGFAGKNTLSFRQIFSNAEDNTAQVDVQVTADADLHLDGVYFILSVPTSVYGHGSGQLIGADPPHDAAVSFATTRPSDDRHYIDGKASGARFVSPHQQIELALPQSLDLVIQDNRAGQEDGDVAVLIPLITGDLKHGQAIHKTFSIKASSDIDKTPITVQIDPALRGSPSAGVGGDFVWGTQSPTTNFYLDNLHVTWARVGMPLQLWQPKENSDPSTQKLEDLPQEIRESLRISSELHRRNIPMIISVWNAPTWAYTPPPAGQPIPPRPGGPIAPDKWDELAKCIGSYLLMFKQNVGVEPDLFSFNESNLGIQVKLSPTQHRDAIKKLGSYFESIGLKTKLLLGDVSEPRPVDFVNPTLDDPAAMKYVGAMSYHSWNGGTTQQLVGWHQQALRGKIPLLITEAGTDPEAHRYPTIFTEPWYAVNEAAMYVQCLELSQPLTMMHWELTPDYGFIRTTQVPTDPTQLPQRWWQFKQLASLTPANSNILNCTSNNAEIIPAALANADQGVSVIHLVNTGPEREVTIAGLPADVKQLQCHLTDATHSMAEQPSIAAADGTVHLTLPSLSFVTLTNAAK